MILFGHEKFTAFRILKYFQSTFHYLKSDEKIIPNNVKIRDKKTTPICQLEMREFYFSSNYYTNCKTGDEFSIWWFDDCLFHSLAFCHTFFEWIERVLITSAVEAFELFACASRFVIVKFIWMKSSDPKYMSHISWQRANSCTTAEE